MASDFVPLEPGGSSAADAAGAAAPDSGGPAGGGGAAGAIPGGVAGGEGIAKRVTAAEVARDWGTSRAYVSSCMKKGCPADSLEAARKWRVEHAKYGIGYRSKGRAPAAEVEEKAAETQKAPPVGEARVVSYELGSLQLSLKAAIMVEEESLRLVREAQLGQQKGGMLESRLRAYNVACKNRSEREAAVREELERQRIMVRMDEAKELFGRGWKEVVPKLRALGSQIGIRCNQADPLLAATTIDYEIAAILKEGEKAYAA